MTAAGGPEWFVYWKTREPQRAAEALHAAHARLMRQWPGLQARLLQRAPGADGRSTQMAIYRRAGGVDAATGAAIGAALDAALAGLLDGRHVVEVFDPLDRADPAEPIAPSA